MHYRNFFVYIILEQNYPSSKIESKFLIGNNVKPFCNIRILCRRKVTLCNFLIGHSFVLYLFQNMLAYSRQQRRRRALYIISCYFYIRTFPACASITLPLLLYCYISVQQRHVCVFWLYNKGVVIHIQAIKFAQCLICHMRRICL